MRSIGSHTLVVFEASRKFTAHSAFDPFTIKANSVNMRPQKARLTDNPTPRPRCARLRQVRGDDTRTAPIPAVRPRAVFLPAVRAASSLELPIMRILFALPGLHRYDRGAEIAFIAIASQLSTWRRCDPDRVWRSAATSPYRFLHAGSLRREIFENFRRCRCFAANMVMRISRFCRDCCASIGLPTMT